MLDRGSAPADVVAGARAPSTIDVRTARHHVQGLVMPSAATAGPPAASPGSPAITGSPAAASAAVTGSTVTLDGRRFYRIDGYDHLPPFFMTIVGASDLWLFISSSGGLTAGRGDAEHALFPYYTDDKITESAAHTGGLTAIRVAADDGASAGTATGTGTGTGTGTVVWQPFAPTRPGDPPVHRAILKDDLGTALVLEESRPDLGLRLRVTWTTSGRYGVVRACELSSTGGRAREVEVLDGVTNLLPAGISSQTQNEFSVLLDAYKRAELDPATGLGTVFLNSTLTDRAEPSESLQASVAWHTGLDDVTHLLSSRQVGAFLAGDAVTPEHDVRGERGAYLVVARLTLAPDEARTWRTVLDTPRSAAGVVALADELADAAAITASLADDVAHTRTELEALVGAADGAQRTGEDLAAAHHGANVLFNVMRGGVPADGGRVSGADVRAFVALRSPRTARRCAGALAALADRLTLDELVAAGEATEDVDLVRLVREYLPLTFSRRHGDPSRPWNRFRIAAHDAQGNLRIDYQGNWRDILQNWEALAWSFPELVDPMLQVLLDATTADGYNPYRISRAGVDWEVPEPGNPWSNIGYWSDHQIVYLCRLLETSQRFHPGRLDDLVDRPIYTHADVPYRIAPYDDIVRDPVHTIAFDEAADAAVRAREAAEGADARLLHGAYGDLVRVTLAEKLLLPLAAKLVNLVPDGGVWMTTQRPEWNDANNALVGRGLSVVTLAQLRRYVVVLRDLLTRDVTLTDELADLLTDVHAALARHADRAATGFTDAERRAVMDELGEAGGAFRARVYAGIADRRVVVGAGAVRALLDVALVYVDAGLRANRRADGLFHSYNVIALGDGTAAVRRLQVMLEGQVAVLSAGLLTPDECLEVLAALRASALYRADQHSYILYPDRQLPRFLERNHVPAARVSALMAALAAAGDESVVLRDVHGDVRFAPGIHNARDVVAALDALPADLAGAADEPARAQLLATFEDVFRHAEFTGRSGSFFAYEGLGSIYWHMVAKLLLAVQENLERAVAVGAGAGVVDALRAAYEDVRHGLGYCKPPQVYGAFPIDPYSHTPAGKGAKQPGMTGQVKEEVLTRLGELGLRVEGGAVVLAPVLLRASEWTTAASTFRYRDVAGVPREIALEPGSLAFTFCQVPVVYRRSGGATSGDGATGDGGVGAAAGTSDGGVGAAPAGIVVTLDDGTQVRTLDRLDPGLSSELFARTGRVTRVTVDLRGEPGHRPV